MRVACLGIALLWTASAAGDVLYRLPWPEGRTFIFTQVPGGRITSHFTKDRLNAVDIAMPEDVPVLAARGGIVEATEASHGATAEEDPLSYEGNFVRVRHADGTAAIYAHLKYRTVTVAAGDAVDAGQVLGHSGSSGDIVEPHLHFAVLREKIDPSGWREDLSLPVQFYIGVPPVAFAPRAALRVTANYSGPAEAPRAPSETPLFSWKRPVPEPGREAEAWWVLALWLALGVAGLVWFWRFSSK
jgi:murein DD-endopeptidase MepM/ murein hydrolase activator NlpD